jgi:hypothetical protein
MRGMRQVRFGWDDVTATYENDLPAGTNVSGYAMLEFRAGVNWFDARNPVGSTQDFSITLTDGAGNSSTIDGAPYSAPLFYPPGEQGQIRCGPSGSPCMYPNFHLAAVPRLLLNTMRVPLSAFTGIDLTDVRSVVFAFDQAGTGALNITDLMFSD